MRKPDPWGCSAMLALVILFALVCAFIYGMAQSAAAAPQPAGMPCGEVTGMEKVLFDNYGEVAFIQGTTKVGNGMRTYVNKKTGTWTIGIQGNNLLCIVITGSHFELVTEGTAL